ncbi:MAG: M56 family metallopeptidase [Bacteroidaceae bacterium]|nr:M56 family metallopeptidase [Bacteroidaceae bacterium]
MLPYIIKSILTLSVLYLPYMLLLRKESFFRFNRLMLLTIMVLSLVLPLMDIHEWAWAHNPMSSHLKGGFIEVGTPFLTGTEGAATAEATATHAWRSADVWALITCLYILGMTATLLVKGIQIALLYRSIHRGVLWTEQRGDVTLYCHTGEAAPFSWMHAIVIGEEDYNSNASTILRHEMGHILHHHSYDILLLNLCQVVQWANPFVWVLANSLRDVHEYEADDHVLRSGINATQYQNHLIQKAIGSSSYAFANGFNHSLLKKRITMMLQKKSNPWMRTKALYLIPVAAVALSAFATPVINNAASNLSDNSGKVTTNSANRQTSIAENASITLPDGDKVYDICEKLPTFKGGEGAMIEHLVENLKYPQVAMESHVQGRILVQFVVNKDGSLSDYSISKNDAETLPEVVAVSSGQKAPADKKGITSEQFNASKKALEEEAIRVVKLMDGKWTPGTEKGEAVRVKFNLPVIFRLK